jgi:hypothetical protein
LQWNDLQYPRRVDGSYRCSQCGFPMCNKECEAGALHAYECRVFVKADFEAEIEDPSVPDNHYAAILPLRCLALRYLRDLRDHKDRDLRDQPAGWQVFSSFLSHCEGRRGHAALWAFHQEHSVEMLRDVCEMAEEVAKHKIRILEYQLCFVLLLRPPPSESPAVFSMIERPNQKSLVNGLVSQCADIKIR